MFEWRLTPEYINRRWSEELLAYMFQARNRRVRRTNPDPDAPPAAPKSNRVSDAELFGMMGVKVETVN